MSASRRSGAPASTRPGPSNRFWRSTAPACADSHEPDALPPAAAPCVAGVQAPATVDIRVFPSQYFRAERLDCRPLRGRRTLWPPSGGHSFSGASLHICFVDEAGDLGALGNPPQPNDQPVLAIGGLFVDAANLANLTDNFLTLKYQYFPGLPYPSARHLDRILPEVKGADIRSNATRGNARQRGATSPLLSCPPSGTAKTTPVCRSATSSVPRCSTPLRASSIARDT